jgi:hypothetical protein
VGFAQRAAQGVDLVLLADTGELEINLLDGIHITVNFYALQGGQLAFEALRRVQHQYFLLVFQVQFFKTADIISPVGRFPELCGVDYPRCLPGSK